MEVQGHQRHHLLVCQQSLDSSNCLAKVEIWNSTELGLCELDFGWLICLLSGCMLDLYLVDFNLVMILVFLESCHLTLRIEVVMLFQLLQMYSPSASIALLML